MKMTSNPPTLSVPITAPLDENDRCLSQELLPTPLHSPLPGRDSGPKPDYVTPGLQDPRNPQSP